MNTLTSSTGTTVQPRRARRRKGVGFWAGRVLLGLLALLVGLAALGASYQVVATAIDQRSYPAPGQLVDVGGYNLHIYCIGPTNTGNPTVILEAGLGAIGSPAWGWIQPEVARTTHVCAYDRAGMGWSTQPSSRHPRDGQQVAHELHALLQAAGVPAPYVLVGWSYGGLYARTYAGQYPEQVAGMVLLDSSHPDQWTSTAAGQALYATTARLYALVPFLARIGVPRLLGLFQPVSGLPTPHDEAMRAIFIATKDWDAQSAEFLASPATNDQVRVAGTLGDRPLYIVTATDHGTPPEQEQLWQAWQQQLTTLSTNSVHQIVAGANHASLLFNEADAHVSAAAILKVVEAARTGLALAR
jgi:pimeloyl-ACP methyl ester carboxylesterase